MSPVLPPALRPGDLVAVISPANPAAAFLTAEVDRGIAALEALGFRVRMMPNARARRRWTAGTIAERLDDLHAALVDPEVKAVLYAIGGEHSIQLLPGLDMDLVRAHPKAIIGYSDATTLLTAIHEETGLVTYYGPALIPQFGELPTPYDETSEHFVRVLSHPEAPGPLPTIDYQVVDLDFGRREREQRPRDRTPAPPRRVLRAGAGEGPALAACLPSLTSLLGTRWSPDLRGRVLFLETPEPPYTPATADADLWHLRTAGLLDGLAALVLGRPLGWSEEQTTDFYDALMEAVEDGDYPVLAEVEFGHTNPILTIPNGVRTAVDGTSVSLLGPAVAGE